MSRIHWGSLLLGAALVLAYHMWMRQRGKVG